MQPFDEFISFPETDEMTPCVDLAEDQKIEALFREVMDNHAALAGRNLTLSQSIAGRAYIAKQALDRLRRIQGALRRP
jgi:hypothetical protein